MRDKNFSPLVVSDIDKWLPNGRSLPFSDGMVYS